MRSVSMYGYAIADFGVYVAAHVIALFRHKALFARRSRTVRESRAEKSRAHHKIIVFFHFIPI